MNDRLTNPSEGSPFHAGEQAVQERLGVRDIEDWARKVVRDHLPEQHRTFHTAQPFLVAAARDRQDRPWVTLLDGPDGFVTSPDPGHLVIRSKPSPGDALEQSFTKGADIGILGIELATRRRNRVNGRIAESTGDAITFRVDQAFGNCPQYIRERGWRRVDDRPPASPRRGTALTPDQQAWIETADTFFIASGFRGAGDSPAFGMDASHRGGERGFVRSSNGTRLQFPDYAGNNHYNTIGNLVLDPRAGFLFIDFETGSLLQLTGTTSIDWDAAGLDDFPSARRLVTLDVEEIVELPSATSLRWAADADSVRSLRLVDKIPESDDVTSFVFEARDGGPLAAFEPGQHLPIELAIPGLDEPARRTYSLSSAPGTERYRISVKREPGGLVSGHLHDRIEAGAIIDARHPAGDFMMTCNVCPL
ncbi:MAG: ferredoxin, partial [Rhizobiales bacterium]|nr:ferredoxin [Hyphomicrobiales bacterium]